MTELVLGLGWFPLLRTSKVGPGVQFSLKDGVRAWCDENIPGWDQTYATMTISGPHGMVDFEALLPVIWFKSDADHMLFVMRWQHTAEMDDEF